MNSKQLVAQTRGCLPSHTVACLYKVSQIEVELLSTVACAYGMHAGQPMKRSNGCSVR